MLAVAPPASRFSYLAPAPVSPVPAWISAAPVVHPPTRREFADTKAALDLFIGLGLERLRSGQLKVTMGGLMSAMRLHHDIDKASDPSLKEWQTFAILLFDEVHKRLDPADFEDLKAELTRQYGTAITMPGNAA